MPGPARPTKRRPHEPAARALPPRAPLTPPQLALLAVAGAVIAGLGVSYRIYDPDLWQHLRVGRAIWEMHAIPRTNLWSWPTWGAPYVLPSWLFRVLVWPVFHAGGEWGLLAWRWTTTLVAFGIAAFTARRMGARGAAAIPAIVWCALLYRQRSMVRPETLAVVLLAAEMAILEVRRRGGRDLTLLLVPLTALWINLHVSWYFALALPAFHIAAEAIAVLRRRPGARWPVRLALVLAASGAACFAHPFGARAVAEPFRYLFDLRTHALYRQILELRPITWEVHRLDGLPLWMILAPALWLHRLVRGRADLVDALVYALFFPLALDSQRFLGFLTVAAAPIFARDVSELAATIRLPAPLERPAARTALALGVMVAGAAPQLLLIAPWRPGLGFDEQAYPVRACDWIERHDVRGRSFSAFHQAGYLLWRFWPDRGRLPFMDIHQTATREDEDLYAAAWSSPPAWQALDAKYRFDWVMLPRVPFPGQDLGDRMDADSTWALVFLDDVASLWLRRSGPLGALAERERYRIQPAGERVLPERMADAQAGLAGRAALRAELERQVRESEWTWHAHSALATLDLLDRRWADAVAELERTHALEPDAPLLAERLRMARDSLGRP
jgi:hypothetical protein